MDVDGMVALLNYRVSQNVAATGSDLIAYFSRRMGLLVRIVQAGLSPSTHHISIAFFTFWKHGLKEVKQ
jgi:hypothetical protein